MTDSNRAIVIWLLTLCMTIGAMIVVGGVTRLTESGLSMVDWRPIVGIIPPIGEEQWEATFERYKAFPQYQTVNQHMDLEGFKSIFYWEYGHRVLGRLIGAMFIIPFAFFWFTGRIERRWMPRLVGALVLGGMQGLLGWYMVKSGLVDIPRVSHFRLAAHLLLAMFILSFLFWLVLDMVNTRREHFGTGIRALALSLGGLIVLQILYGAFTAGIRAGYGYNTWPLMNGQFAADAVFFMQPWWINLFESAATIQFIHRWLAAVVLIVSLVAMVRLRSAPGLVPRAATVLFCAIVVQFGLGVATLIHVVPIPLASLHQAWACIVLVSLVFFLYVTVPGPRSTV
ncbi:MAG: COX15/CtaA family protein [Pseudomonadales bacterium]|nr:COX15/CtaA family protein [Pseudomonadales bacterium]